MTQLVSLRSFEPSPLLRQAATGPPVGELVVLKKDFITQRQTIRIVFQRLRGERRGLHGLFYPTTTNADVASVINNWTSAVRRFGKSSNDKSARDRWLSVTQAWMEDIITKPPGDEFTENERFWNSELKRVAVWLGSLGAIPSKEQRIKESVIESIKELPGTLGSAAATVAKVVGDVASGLAGGVARGLGITPVNAAIALAVVGGVGYAVMRSRKKDRKA